MRSNLNVSNVSGSATGNPRNKTALKPGFSLVGWIRLGSSGEDLTGLQGKIIQVSHQELAKHNKASDCWMAIRGKVYNVTRYLDYHPGGHDQLIRGAGKDATSLFDEYHAWVNIDQLLSKCYVGPLRNTVKINLKDSSSNMDLRTKLSPPSSTTKFPSILSVSSEALSKSSYVDKELATITQPIEVIPRFDWIQKSTELSIYFYTKSFCNPGISIDRICDKESEIKIFIAGTSNSYKFSFLKSLKWPCSTKINQETGKVEISFEKNVPELWSNFGIFERKRTKEETYFNAYAIVTKKFFNNDSFELIIRPQSEKLLVIPIGYHLNFRLSVHGSEIVRSYTPIQANIFTKEAIKRPPNLLFLIKAYSTGTLSSLLALKSPDEVVFVSQPKGNLDLLRLKNHSRFALMAAGSGITPMISVLDHLLDRSSIKIEKVDMLYFNKKESDIWMRETFDELEKRDKRFSIKHILSEPDVSWKGDFGRVTEAIAHDISKSATFVFVCGPAIFNDITSQFFQTHNIQKHFFQG